MPADADFPGCWVHFIATTYGAWLPGDARGFRTRHHREHVAGDYKNPPPQGKYARRAARSRDELRQPPVALPPSWRKLVAHALRQRLTARGAFVLCLAQAAQHAHVLAKLPRNLNPRMIMGLAKKHAAFELKRCGWQGALWARRGREIAVRSRSHQLAVYHYILQHAEQGAIVWAWKPESRKT